MQTPTWYVSRPAYNGLLVTDEAGNVHDWSDDELVDEKEAKATKKQKAQSAKAAHKPQAKAKRQQTKKK